VAGHFRAREEAWVCALPAEWEAKPMTSTREEQGIKVTLRRVPSPARHVGVRHQEHDPVSTGGSEGRNPTRREGVEDCGCKYQAR
jgi:hypothetical protein